MPRLVPLMQTFAFTCECAAAGSMLDGSHVCFYFLTMKRSACSVRPTMNLIQVLYPGCIGIFSSGLQDAPWLSQRLKRITQASLHNFSSGTKDRSGRFGKFQEMLEVVLVLKHVIKWRIFETKHHYMIMNWSYLLTNTWCRCIWYTCAVHVPTYTNALAPTTRTVEYSW